MGQRKHKRLAGSASQARSRSCFRRLLPVSTAGVLLVALALWQSPFMPWFGLAQQARGRETALRGREHVFIPQDGEPDLSGLPFIVASDELRPDLAARVFQLAAERAAMEDQTEYEAAMPLVPDLPIEPNTPPRMDSGVAHPDRNQGVAP